MSSLAPDPTAEIWYKAAANAHCRHQPPVTMNEQEQLQQKLAMLKSEHRDLDDVIARIAEQVPFDQLQLQRLKKRKLMLKDQIALLESRLLPDIIA